MVGSVGSATACYGSSLGSNPDISQKYKMGDISKNVAPPKKLMFQKCRIFFNHKFLKLWSSKAWILNRIHQKAGIRIRNTSLVSLGPLLSYVSDAERHVSLITSSLHPVPCFNSSVPDPDPPDPRVFGPPGSGSTSQRYGSGSGSCSGSGSFYH
jgi:hypothetical protein